MSLIQLPDEWRRRILQRLDSLPQVEHGKVMLTVELNCGTGGKLNSMRVKQYIEDEVRP